jgi:hypothetical protein
MALPDIFHTLSHSELLHYPDNSYDDKVRELWVAKWASIGLGVMAVGVVALALGSAMIK